MISAFGSAMRLPFVPEESRKAPMLAARPTQIVQTFAGGDEYSPQVYRSPLTGESFDAMWLINALIWLVLFVAGTTWAFRRDTKRV